MRSKPAVKRATLPHVQRKARRAYQADQPEKSIQASILAYLRAKGVLCWKNRAVGIWKASEARYIPVPKAERGVSDIVGVLKGGRTLVIEVKRAGEQPTDEQEAFLVSVHNQGGLAFVARSIDDVQAQGI